MRAHDSVDDGQWSVMQCISGGQFMISRNRSAHKSVTCLWFSIDKNRSKTIKISY